MCGIAGIINYTNKPVDPFAIARMTNALAHRGPDAEGFFNDSNISLGHRRLSILDVSSGANQPFRDSSGRYIMIFNGEIYNYREIKEKLSGYSFHTTGDTEVLLAAYVKWGPACLGRLRGMFAFAVWDLQEEEMFIARDGMGVKPLYYHLDADHCLFSSEVRSLMASGLIPKKISIPALRDYFSFQSVGYPHSIIEGIEQLEAGSWIKISKGKLEKTCYWQVTDTLAEADFTDTGKVKKRVRELMLQAVEKRLVSDVPVGAFLSGGIDSSAVVGLMAEAGKQPPNTFNISFEEKEFDESCYAELVAKKFNANHTRIVLKSSVFLDELQNALNAMDTPSGDGINTYVVSKMIRRAGMTVALSGIGGDELFAGYPLFDQYLQLRQKKWICRLPVEMRKLFGNVVSPVLSGKNDRLQQLLRLPSFDIEQVYPVFRQIFSPKQIDGFTNISSQGHFITAIQKDLTLRKEDISRLPLLSQVSVAEYLGYTQSTLLKDADQMSMATSLEIREPFFDLDLVGYVLSIPDHLKTGSFPKSLLVESLMPLLPDEIVHRKKQGFLFPWNVWIRKDLRTFCERHIQNMATRPFIHGRELLDYWRRFLNGDENIRWAELWLFVVLDYWMQKNDVG